MANNNITLLKDVKGYRRNTTVKVKIANLWKLKMNGTEDQTYRVDMILMDEKENFIYCTCHHKVLKDFEKMLFLDNTIFITNPTVTKDEHPRYVEHHHKIAINGRSTVSTCTNWEGPKFGFKFANFKDVLENKYKDKEFIDFIGYVRVCNELGMVNKRTGVESPKINFKLRNLDGIEIHASLWEDNAIAMSKFMNDKKRDPHVFIIVQFGAINKYQGETGVTNTFDASRVFFNADVEEMLSFKMKYFEKFIDNESSDSSNSSSGSLMISSIEEEFLHKCGFSLARYITTMSTANKLILVATIIEISNELKWYYRGCNFCKSKVEKVFQSYEKEDGSVGVREVWECKGKSCPGLEVHEVIRFRILIKVKDCSSTTTLTLFDTDAKKIFGKTAQEFVQEEEEIMNNGGTPPEYPIEFEKLIGEKYAFIIKVSDYNIEHQIEQYSISMLTQDDNILSGVYKKFDIEKLEKRISNEEICFTEIEHANDNVLKGDEDVPIENNNDDEDICEVDGSTLTRTRKRPRLDGERHEVAKEKIKLLTPKIEKD